MRNFIAFSTSRVHKAYTLKTSFTSKQTFEHMLISCQSALLKILLCRELRAAVYLCQSGSDCCETLYSALGGCGAIQTNSRTYDFDGATEMLGDFGLMQDTTSGVDEDGASLVQGKKHRKQDVHYKHLGEDADASDA